MFEQKTKLIDVSKWNGLFNWSRAKNNGVKGAFIRVGSIDNATGLCYTDYQFEANVANVNVPWGGYWYFRPNWSATQQAGYFTGLLKNHKFNLLPVIDVEADVDFSVYTPKVYADRVADFIFNTTKTLNLSHMIIYSRQSFWDVHIEKRTGWANQDLWLARYANLQHPWSDGNYVPRDWKRATFWQYTNKGDGLGYGNGPTSNGATAAQIDLDWFDGNEADFNKYAGVNPEPTQQEKWMAEIDAWARTQGYAGTKPF